MTSLTDLLEVVDVVIGVDTHVHTHCAAVVEAATGGVLDEVTVEATVEGYSRCADECTGRRFDHEQSQTGWSSSAVTRWVFPRLPRTVQCPGWHCTASDLHQALCGDGPWRTRPVRQGGRNAPAACGPAEEMPLHAEVLESCGHLAPRCRSPTSIRVPEGPWARKPVQHKDLLPIRAGRRRLDL